MKKSIPEISADARFLIDALKAVRAGDTISYADLTKLIGRDVRADARGCLSTARRHCERDGIVFGAIRKEGLKRLGDTELCADYVAAGSHIARTARRSLRRMNAVENYADLPPDKRQQLDLGRTLMALHLDAESSRVRAKVEAKVAEEKQQLPVGRLLAFLSKGK